MKRKKLLKGITNFFGFALYPLLASLIGTGVNEYYPKLLDYFGGSKALLLLIFILVSIPIYFAQTYYQKGDKEEKIDVDIGKRQQLLESLKDRYSKRKELRMDDEINFQLKLTLRYTKEGTENDFVNKNYIRDYTQKMSNDVGNLFEEFATSIHSLLILGEAGSGKTVLLLDFACHFIDKAILDDNHPIPIILNLASWRNGNRDFSNWLEENLVYAAGESGISRRYAKQLMRSYNLFLLLDGLDEIPAAHRDSCLREIKSFILKQNSNNSRLIQYPQLIICSRTKDYIATAQNAPVTASVLIEPLNKYYVLDCLQEKSELIQSARILLYHIRKKSEISDSLTTAFNVHLALHLAKEGYDFKEYSWELLLEEYCIAELKKIRGYKPEIIEWYLKNLAFILGNTKKVVAFELSDIQQNWLEIIPNDYYSSRGEWLAKTSTYRIMLECFRTLVIAMFIGIPITIILFVVEDKTLNWPMRLILPPILTLICAVPIGLVLAVINTIFFKKEVVIREILQFNPSEFSFKSFFISFKSSFLKTVAFVTIVVFIGGIIFGIDQTSLYEIGGLKNALIISYNHGTSFAKHGFEMNIFPLYIHCVILIGILVYSAYLSLYKKKFLLFKKQVFQNVLMNKIAEMINLLSDLAIRFICGLFLQGLLIGFIYGFVMGPFYKFFTGLTNVTLRGMLIAIALGVVTGIYNGLIDNLFSTKSNPKIDKPYKRFSTAMIFDFFKLSFPLSISCMIISALVIHGIPVSKNHFSNIILSMIGIQLVVVIIVVYRNPIINHFTIRFMLFFQRRMPLRLKKFLHRVSETGLIEKDGGQWRFRHQLIQDRFSNL